MLLENRIRQGDVVEVGVAYREEADEALAIMARVGAASPHRVLPASATDAPAPPPEL